MRPPATGKSTSQASLLPRLRFGDLAALFLALLFLYVCFRVEPSLEYQHSGPVFRSTGAFLEPFLTYPGGLLDYAAAFLAQLNYYDWLGAVVYTAMASLILFGARAVCRNFNAKRASVAPFVIVFLLLVSREQYYSDALVLGLGLLLAILVAWGYFGIAALRLNETGERRLKRLSRLVLCWASSAVLFYLGGIWPCVLLAVLAGLFEWGSRGASAAEGHWVSGLATQPHSKALNRSATLPVPTSLRPGTGALRLLTRSLVGAVFALGPILMIGLWMLRIHESDHLSLLNPWGKGLFRLLAITLYLLLPVACIALRFLPEHAPADGEKHRGTRGHKQGRYLRMEAGESVLMVVLFLLGWIVVWQGLAVPRKSVAEIDYYSNRRNYEKVLAVAATLQRERMDFASESRLHLALYHTGKLGEEVFSYRNQSAWDLLPGLGGGLDSCRAQSRTLFELGLVSEAEHLAHEALENEGERPELLRLLAEVNVLKERPNAARVFLHVLSQIPFQKAWAETCLSNICREPRLMDNAQLEGVRRLMPTNDLAHQVFPAENMLVQLLYCNPTNKMAFEYLMAEYLMNLEVNKLVERLGQLDNFSYAAIPRHYEEALLLYEQTKGAQVQLPGRKIRPETIERFRQFNAAMDRRLFSTEEGRQALAREFGDTYWYYYVARRSQARQS